MFNHLDDLGNTPSRPDVFRLALSNSKIFSFFGHQPSDGPAKPARTAILTPTQSVILAPHHLPCLETVILHLRSAQSDFDALGLDRQGSGLRVAAQQRYASLSDPRASHHPGNDVRSKRDEAIRSIVLAVRRPRGIAAVLPRSRAGAPPWCDKLSDSVPSSKPGLRPRCRDRLFVADNHACDSTLFHDVRCLRSCCVGFCCRRGTAVRFCRN